MDIRITLNNIIVLDNSIKRINGKITEAIYYHKRKKVNLLKRKIVELSQVRNSLFNSFSSNDILDFYDFYKECLSKEELEKIAWLLQEKLVERIKKKKEDEINEKCYTR